MPPRLEDDTGSLEKARERLYRPETATAARPALAPEAERTLPHAWGEHLLESIPHRGKRHLRLASLFLGTAVAFFVVAFGIAAYFFYFGGNSVSVDKIQIDLEGPTTIAAGDTVPLSLTITNKNPVPIENATIEIDFPDGTLAADGSLAAYPRYTENLGTIESGATVTRSVKAIVFGGAGQALMLPVSLSYDTGGSSTGFVKKASYTLAISSTPLSISIESLTETVSGKPITFALTVRSNASVPLENVVISNSFPFGFSVTKSSPALSGSTVSLGTMRPGESKTVMMTGTLAGQNGEERVFHFTVGTAKSANDSTVAIAYMTQDASVRISAPFIATTLAINGSAGGTLAIAPDTVQSATLSYANTLLTNVTNAQITVALSGSAVDYDSIRTSNGFYRSSDHAIVFSRDTDPSLATLAPGASGIGTFTFETEPAGKLGPSPSITFTISVSGTREGQSNVPEEVRATVTRTIKVATVLSLSTSVLHYSGPLVNDGPVPPVADEETTYTVSWNVANQGSAVAGGVVTATLPSYVSYTGKTSGAGSFSYDEKSHTVSWNVGDLAQGAKAQGYFQISITPSSSQKGSAPALTSAPAFSGYDRFAGVQVSVQGEPATTQARDPGSSGDDAAVQ